MPNVFRGSAGVPRVTVAVAALALVTVGGCSGSDATGPLIATSATAPPNVALDVCGTLELAEPHLRGIETDSFNGERLVDGLGDSAAQLKEVVSELDAMGAVELAAAIDRYDHELTRLRATAQRLELLEATGGGPEEEHAAERSLERRVEHLRSLFEQMGPMLTTEVCPGR